MSFVQVFEVFIRHVYLWSFLLITQKLLSDDELFLEHLDQAGVLGHSDDLSKLLDQVFNVSFLLYVNQIEHVNFNLHVLLLF